MKRSIWVSVATYTNLHTYTARGRPVSSAQELGLRIRTRTQGALRLETRGKLLLIAWHRYARARATSPADHAKAAQWIAALSELVYPDPTGAAETRAREPRS